MTDTERLSGLAAAIREEGDTPHGVLNSDAKSEAIDGQNISGITVFDKNIFENPDAAWEAFSPDPADLEAECPD